MKDIIFWGATGQSIAIEEFISEVGYKIIALFDNNKNVTSPFKGIPIYYQKEGFFKWKRSLESKEVFFITTIGGEKGVSRCEISRFLINENLKPATVIHPSAKIAKNASIAKGCQILINSTIGARAQIGKYVIINSASSIDHECVINEGAHIGPGAILAGCVKIGKFSFVGSNATVLPRISIGSNVIVGAGSVVTKNIPSNCVVIGSPAKVVKQNTLNSIL